MKENGDKINTFCCSFCNSMFKYLKKALGSKVEN